MSYSGLVKLGVSGIDTWMSKSSATRALNFDRLNRMTLGVGIFINSSPVWPLSRGKTSYSLGPRLGSAKAVVSLSRM